MSRAHPPLEVREGARLLLRAAPVGRRAPAIGLPPTPRPRGRVVLSRFACLRRVRRHWTLESPLAALRLELRDPRAARLVEALAQPRSAGDLAAAAGVSAPTARAALALFHAAGLLTRVGRDYKTREDRDPALATWEFADLLLHAESRLGFHDRPVGATFPFLGRLAPLPAVKRYPTGSALPLPRPRARVDSAADRPFTAVLEQRRSRREFGGPPLTPAELGEFLFRAARVMQRLPPNPGRPYPATSRPYPSGGACYPIEIYLAAGRCRGLPSLLYHYDPVRHALTPIPGSRPAVRRFLADARRATLAREPPQALLIFSARFGRVSWKYRSLAYATVLKDVGALLQTMYLVASAMELSGCAAGCGNALLLADTIGSPFYKESSVGEFLLGRGRNGAS